MNISQCLTKSARSFSDNLAIAHGEKRLSYAEFNGRANRLANALYKQGIRQGDNLALLMYNCPEMLESMFAGFKAGCGVVPINFRLHPKEYAFIIMHSEAEAVIVSSRIRRGNHQILPPFSRVSSPLLHCLRERDNLLDYEFLLAAESDQYR